MPRLAGVNLLGVLLATLGFYFVGFIWYGVVFSEAWTTEILVFRGAIEPGADLSAQELQAAFEGLNPGANVGLSMALGFLNALLTAFMLGVALMLMQARGLGGALGRAVLIWAGFVVTTLAYDHVYAMQPMTLFWIDASHTLVAYGVAASILSIFK